MDEHEKIIVPVTFDEELLAMGVQRTGITECPEDITLKLPEHLVDGKERYLLRLTVPDVVDVIMLQTGEGKYVACFCFKKTMATFEIGDESKVQKRVIESLKANISNKEQQEKGVEDLQQFIKTENGTQSNITEFPEDLDSADAGLGNMVGKKYFSGRQAKAMRIDFPNQITVLVALPIQRQYYAAAIFKNGKYYGGNHDLNISELRGSIHNAAESNTM